MKKMLLTLAAVMLMLSLTPTAEAQAAGSVPTAQNLELSTRQNMPLRGSLAAQDADGDVIAYHITTKPVKGDIRLLSDGRFLYTPRPGKRGRDYFGYRAIDAEGHVSQEATAIIRIEKA